MTGLLHEVIGIIGQIVFHDSCCVPLSDGVFHPEAVFVFLRISVLGRGLELPN